MYLIHKNNTKKPNFKASWVYSCNWSWSQRCQTSKHSCRPVHKLVLCDFGSAKKLVKGESSVAYIFSRYYRAPELIFAATDYTNAIDMWSARCVIAKMFFFQPLFLGESAVD